MTTSNATSHRVRLIVACGSRGYTSALLVRDTLAEYLEVPFEHSPANPTIIHGAARGADRLIAAEAEDLGFTVKAMPADWTQGRGAGIQRNDAMLDQEPDLVIAFWDGSSRGTLHTISAATRRSIPVRIVPDV